MTTKMPLTLICISLPCKLKGIIFIQPHLLSTIISASSNVVASNMIYYIGAISGIIAVLGCLLGGVKLIKLVRNDLLNIYINWYGLELMYKVQFAIIFM